MARKEVHQIDLESVKIIKHFSYNKQAHFFETVTRNKVG